jgi:alkylation response protein AidB-like acyl-CoA dehydrogenase
VNAVHDDDLTLLAQSIREVVTDRSPPTRVRELRDARDPLGWSRERFEEMTNLGWTALAIPEAHGGLGLGFGAQCVLLEELGRNLVPEPFLSAAVATQAITLSGRSEATDLLAPVGRGEAIVAFASEEGDRPHDGTAGITTTCDAGGLSGEKTGVPDGHGATAYLVTARDADGPSLCLVTADAPGLETRRQWRIDGRHAAVVRFDGAPYVRLGGADLVEAVFDRAAIALAAEMLGGATRAFEDTRAYLMMREQFGVPIGTFQALQHRAARLFIELGVLRSAVHGAAAAVDADAADAARMASMAKAMAADTFNAVTREAIQMHGGIGMTDEHHIGLYLKRARVCEVQWGTAAWHRRRWAELGGY